MSTENYEGSDYNLDLDLLNILYWSRVPYPKRKSGLGGDTTHFKGCLYSIDS